MASIVFPTPTDIPNTPPLNGNTVPITGTQAITNHAEMLAYAALAYKVMLRGRNSQFLEKRETSPNGIEVEFRLESKVIEFSFNPKVL